jgi:hypothetical protein
MPALARDAFTSGRWHAACALGGHEPNRAFVVFSLPHHKLFAYERACRW